MNLPDALPGNDTGTQAWWSRSVADTEGLLGASTGGLDTTDARARLEGYGPNTIRVDTVDPWWALVLNQLRNPLVYILLIATVVTFATEHYVDAGVIFAAVLLNTIVGFAQEYRARQAMQALARLGAPRAEVLRDGEPRVIPAEEVVPGDVVLLQSGTRVPADLRLFRAVDLEVDESALTGESRPVRKDPDALVAGTPVAGDQVNLAFAGTMVSRGRGKGLVIRTGAATEIGRIAEAVHEVGDTGTPLQEKVHDFGTRVGLLIIVLAVLVAALGLAHGLGWTEVFITAVAVAVSAIPEGLPIVLTVTLAVGVHRMAGRRALIRRLPAVETLGSTTVIASDKTGTLTRNQMTVRAVWAGGRVFRVSGVGYDLEGGFSVEGVGGGIPVTTATDAPLTETLRAGALANEADARIVDEDGDPLGDPTEVALLVAAAKGALDARELRRAMPELAVLPFEPERQFMATRVAMGAPERTMGIATDAATDPRVSGAAPSRIYLKGSPESVLARSDRLLGPDGLSTLDVDMVRRAADALASEGLRVLAMAYRDDDGDASPTDVRARDLNLADPDVLAPDTLEGGFVFCGLQAMEDPVRPEAVDAVAEVRRAGIQVLMLTGDHLTTARTIGVQLGLAEAGDRAIEGEEITTMSDEELDAALGAGVRVFARVAPEHKLRIVERLRARGEIVAVTGDGVNDAPALRAAHIGIAMGRGGTDVARDASDMILQDDNFRTIRDAVEEGRVVFANVRKATFFLLSTAVGEVLTILIALALGWPLPFLAAQILWINLVTNGVQDIALAVEPGEPGLLERKPRPTSEGILPANLLVRLATVGLFLTAITLGVFWWTLETTGDVDLARSIAMTQMVVFQFFHVFNCRSLHRSIFRMDPFSNRFLFLSIFTALLAQITVLYWGPFQTIFRTVPLTWEQWGIITAVGTLAIVGGELDKALQRVRKHAIG